MDEMNNLGTSNADYDRYDSLKAQRKGLYKEAMPYLEKALAEKPDYLGVAKTLYNIYQQLGETSKADEVKAKIDALEAGK
jgi:tetratricopeptide (TPR) repeat protein